MTQDPATHSLNWDVRLRQMTQDPATHSLNFRVKYLWMTYTVLNVIVTGEHSNFTLCYLTVIHGTMKCVTSLCKCICLVSSKQ